MLIQRRELYIGKVLVVEKKLVCVPFMADGVGVEENCLETNEVGVLSTSKLLFFVVYIGRGGCFVVGAVKVD